MSLQGTKRERTNFEEQPKYVGIAEAKIVAINPSPEEFESFMSYAPKEDSKQFEYLGETKDGNPYLRVDVWLEEIKERKRDDKPIHEKFKLTYFLEERERSNKDNTKLQYVNAVGVCSWAEDPNDLPDWFKEREYRVANVGEEKFCNFLRMWLSNIDYRSADTVLSLEWKKLMRGNLKEWREQIGGEWANNVGIILTIETVEKDGEIKEYQRVYEDGFLSPYSIKYFRNVDFDDSNVIQKLRERKPRELKPHEKFVLNIKDPERGCRNFYVLKDAKVYDPSENIASSEKVIVDNDPSY